MSSIIEQQTALWKRHAATESDREKLLIERQIKDLEKKKPHGIVENPRKT